MQRIKILEELLRTIDVDIATEVNPCNYKEFNEIKNVIKEFEQKNSEIVRSYVVENDLEEYVELEGLDLEDILEILQSQINTIKDAIKKELTDEYNKKIELIKIK